VFDFASRRTRARSRMQQEGMEAMLLFLSDLTRTYVPGEASARVGQAYRAVRDAYEAARALVRPGIALGADRFAP